MFPAPLRTLPAMVALAAAVLCSGTMATVRADDDTVDPAVREVLARQKGDVLKVYVNESRTYVNGRQLSAGMLTKIVRASGLEQVVITAEPTVTTERLDRIKTLVREGGVEDVTVAEPAPRPVQGAEANRKLILHRQKGDVLKVYVNNRGQYVNGKQISVDTLITLVGESGLVKADITAEPYVTDEYKSYVADALTDAGVTEVVHSAPRPRPVAGSDAKVKLILSRQKGETLKVYLRGRATYVNGRTLSAAELAKVVEGSGLERAELTIEPTVTAERADEIEAAIREAGIDAIERVER